MKLVYPVCYAYVKKSHPSRIDDARTRRVVLALLVGAALAAGCDPSGPTGTAEPRVGDGLEQAIVERVGDGDTVELAGGRRVRLLQIDAPELGEGECYAEESTATLRSLLPRGTAVALESDPKLDDVDRFDRLLRYVLVDGHNLNVDLVRAGAAAPYFRRGERGRHARELEAAVEEARTARRGMWGACEVDLVPDRQVEAKYP